MHIEVDCFEQRTGILPSTSCRAILGGRLCVRISAFLCMAQRKEASVAFLGDKTSKESLINATSTAGEQNIHH